MRQFANTVNQILPFIDLLLIKKGGEIKIPVSDILNRMYDSNYDRPDAQKFVRKFRAFMNNRGYNVDVKADIVDMDIIIISDPKMEHEGDKLREERRLRIEEYHYSELLYNMIYDSLGKELDEIDDINKLEGTFEENDFVYLVLIKKQDELFNMGINFSIDEIIDLAIEKGLKNEYGREI